MKRFVFLISIVLGSCSLIAQAADPDQIVGVWKSPSASVMIKIDKIGDHFQGRIVWIDTQNGKMALDSNNPDEKLQKMPLKGNKVIKELSFNANDIVWEGGTFYHHEEGKLYNCTIKVQDSDQLHLTRYLSSIQEGVVETWVRQ